MNTWSRTFFIEFNIKNKNKMKILYTCISVNYELHTILAFNECFRESKKYISYYIKEKVKLNVRNDGIYLKQYFALMSEQAPSCQKFIILIINDSNK